MKNFLKKNFFTVAYQLYLINKFIQIIQNIIRYKINNIPLFSFHCLESFCNLKEIDTIALLGSGYTIQELTSSDFSSFKKMLSIGLGRWYYKDFVPNVIFAEFSENSENWENDWVNEFIDGLNKKADLYKNTMILLFVDDKKFKLHKRIISKFNHKLRNNIRFTILLTSMSDIRFPRYLLNNKLVLFILKKLNIIFHCRSSSFIGASIAIALKKENLILTGVDGYSGYFIKDPNHPFNKVTVSKNIEFELHSTANPNLGRPTITEAFIEASRHINIFTMSENSLLSKYLPIKTNP
tara:strand:- start:835 stop:1719 length:885 start_codon:yes stop_codon:yes gene_type:complete